MWNSRNLHDITQLLSNRRLPPIYPRRREGCRVPHGPAQYRIGSTAPWSGMIDDVADIAPDASVPCAVAHGSIPRSYDLRARLGDDRGAVEGNSRGSHGGECNEPSCDPRYLHPERADRGAVALFPEWQATQRRARHRLGRTLSLGLTMRPLRGRTEVGGGTAGRVCSLHSPPRPTAISFDRSAVEDRLWRCSGIRGLVALSIVPTSCKYQAFSDPLRRTLAVPSL